MTSLDQLFAEYLMYRDAAVHEPIGSYMWLHLTKLARDIAARYRKAAGWV